MIVIYRENVGVTNPYQIPLNPNKQSLKLKSELVSIIINISNKDRNRYNRFIRMNIQVATIKAKSLWKYTT
jgi:hypothetical protein